MAVEKGCKLLFSLTFCVVSATFVAREVLTCRINPLLGALMDGLQCKHPFRVIKRSFGYRRVRYRGLAKNAAQVLTLFALSNLWMKRKTLLALAG